MNFPESMKYANRERTSCEVVRELFELVRDDPAAVEKLKEIHTMAKRMSTKLYEYNKEYDKGWWEKNPDYEEDLKRRLNENTGL